MYINEFETALVQKKWVKTEPLARNRYHKANKIVKVKSDGSRRKRVGRQECKKVNFSTHSENSKISPKKLGKIE